MSYDENNIFAKILRGEIPSNKIYEDDEFKKYFDDGRNGKVGEYKTYVLTSKDENKIKRYHVRNLVERFDVSPNEIVFLDDTKNVVDDCINTCGIRAILVDATKGFQISDLLDNL